MRGSTLRSHGAVMPSPTTITILCRLAVHASAAATGQGEAAATPASPSRHIGEPGGGSGSANSAGVVNFERQFGPPPPYEETMSSGKTMICAACAAALADQRSTVATFFSIISRAPFAEPSHPM